MAFLPAAKELIASAYNDSHSWNLDNKFQYFLPLVDKWLAEQASSLADALGSLAANLEGVMGAMHLQEEERAGRERRLEELIPQVKEIEARLTAPTPPL